MAVSPTPPSISILPPAPLPTDAEAVFDAKAGASLTAQAAMVPEVNAALAWQAGSMAETEGYKKAAATSANNAADSATDASAQVALAAAQVTLAGSARSDAQAARDSAQVYAAAASSAAGLPALGNPGDSLQVTPNRNGVMFGPADGQVGTVQLAVNQPGSLWLPANGAIRAQASAPTLFAALGSLASTFGVYWEQRPSGITGTGAAGPIDIDSNPSTGVVIAIFGGSPTTANAMRSINRGSGWAPLVIGPLATNPLSAIASDGSGGWVAILASGIAYRSLDDGVTWTAGSAVGVAIGRVAGDGNGVWIATPSATSTLAYRSTDYGVTWTAILTGATAVHTDIASDGQGVWHILAGATIRRSTNGGIDWSSQTMGTTLAAIATDRNGTWFTAGTSAQTYNYKSVDNGQTWISAPVLPGATQNVTDICYAKGFFFYVRNITSQVVSISAAPDAAAFFVSVGVVQTSSYKITYSGGNVLNIVNTVNANTSMGTGYVGYDAASQFKLPNVIAPDGLRAWIKAGLMVMPSGKSFSQGSVVGIGAGDMDSDGKGTIIAVGPTTIRRSVDSGLTWETVNSPSGALYSVATDKNGLWIIGGSASVLRSTDNGKTFSVVPPANHGFTGVGVAQITIGKDGVMIGCPTSAVIAPRKSADGGQNWTAIAGVTAVTVARSATDGLGRWLLAQGASAFTSTDNGATFGPAVATGLSGTVTGVVMTDDGKALIAGTTATGIVSYNYGNSWLSTTSLPSTSMKLLRGLGNSVLGFSLSGGPWVADNLIASGTPFTLSKISGAQPSGVVAAAGGKYVPFIMVGILAPDRVIYTGNPDIPV